MKKPKSVRDAEVAVDAKKAELEAARATATRLEKEWVDAMAHLRITQTTEDAKLPQCNVVRVHYGSGTIEACRRVVIVRRTPGGSLVVRHVGASAGTTRYQWSANRGRYELRDSGSWSAWRTELHNVPPEFMPTNQNQETT